MGTIDKTSSSSLVLKNKPFRTLLLNQILVQIASSAVNFALIIKVFELTGKNVASSLFVLTGIMPAIFFGVVTGIIADRLNKRTIIQVTEVVLALIFILYLFVHNSILAILLLAVAGNVAIQFFVPTESATIPYVVPPKYLLQANALYYICLFTSAMLGYTLAGPVIEQFGFGAVFLGAALCLGLGFAVCQSLPQLPSSGKPVVWRNLALSSLMKSTIVQAREGIVFMYKSPRVWIAMVILVVMQLISGMLTALGPGYMEQVLHLRATASSLLLLLPAGLGIVSGLVLVGKYGQRFIKRYLIVFGVFLSSVSIVGLGVIPSLSWGFGYSDTSHIVLPISLATFLLGVGGAAMLIPAQTILQYGAKAHVRGRVFASLEMFKATASALPILLAGTIADVFGIISVLLAVGIALLGVSAILYRVVRFEKYF